MKSGRLRFESTSTFRAALISILSLLLLWVSTGSALADTPAGPSKAELGQAEVVIKDRLKGSGTLSQHSPGVDDIGSGWSEVRPQWELTSRGVQETAGADAEYRAVIDAGLTNVHISSQVTYAGGQVGLVFRYKDSQNWHMFVYDGKKLRLNKSIAGTVTEVASKGFRWREHTHTMEITADGDDIRGLIDGRELLRATDSDLFGETRAGFYYMRDTETRFSDFEVRALGPEVVPESMVIPTPGESIVYDSFTDDDGTALSTHSPEVKPGGSSWVAWGVNWEIEQGQAGEVTGADQDNRAVIQTGITDQEIHASITWVSDMVGLVFRYSDEGNWFMAWYDGREIIVAKVTSQDGFRELARILYDWGNPGTTRHLRIRNNGKSIRLYIDDVMPLLWVQDEDLLNATSAGMVSRKGSSNRFDWFAVRTAEPLPVPDPEFPPYEPPEPPPPPPLPPEGAVIYDSFTDWSYMWLPVHTVDVSPQGAKWVLEGGNWFILEQELAEWTGADADHRAVIDSGRDEVQVSARVSWASGRAGVVARYRNEGNWIMFWYSGEGELIVARAVAGRYEEFGRVSYDWRGGPKEMSLVLKDDIGYALINNSQVMSFDASELSTSTKVGLFFRPNIGRMFDDFTVFGLGNEPPPPVPITVVEDTFSDTDNTHLQDHAPDLAPQSAEWIEARGDWEILDQRAKVKAGDDGDHRSVIDAGVADCSISADVTWQNGLVGLVFRYADESNWVMLWLDGASYVTMARLVAGSIMGLGTVLFSWGDAGTTRRLEGALITAYVDGQQVLTASDTLLLSNTSVGLFSRFSTDNTFDNFKVSGEAPVGSGSAIEILAGTYRTTAESLISDAEATTVQDPDNQRKVDRELAKAYEELAKGDAERDVGNFDEAIDHYQKVWGHALRALDYATRPAKEEEEEKCHGIASMTLEYDGGAGVEFTLDKKGKDREFVITDNGDSTYTIMPAPDSKKNKLGASTRIYLDGEEMANIHTSCSKPIETGDVYGDFTIVALEKLY